MASTSPDRKHLLRRLAELRDKPVNLQSAQNDLSTFWDVIMKVPVDSTGVMHWFCSRADALVVEAAVFLTRLHAYNSSKVDEWKTKLESCLHGCVDCTQRFQELRVISRRT
jgi:senataxin